MHSLPARPKSGPRTPNQGASQIDLLRARGDLQPKSTHFQVDLGKPSPIARELHEGDEVSRSGMAVAKHGSASRLVVTDVDRNPRNRSPLAQWNTEETRCADRGEGEVHASHAIQPGDRVKAVVDFHDDDAAKARCPFTTMSQTMMVSELEEAMKPESPRRLSLMVSRDIGDVMAPAVRKKVIAEFRQFDWDGNGSISRREFIGVLTYLRPTVFNERNCATLFDRLDQNRNGELDYEEFIEWFFSDVKSANTVFTASAKAKAKRVLGDDH